MNINEIGDNKDVWKYLNDFVRHPLFLTVKDSFVAHTPGGEAKNDRPGDPTSIEVAHGKFLGTRFVFNEMERITKAPPVDRTRKPQQVHGKDPDLAT
jgi:hypothetical protein